MIPPSKNKLRMLSMSGSNPEYSGIQSLDNEKQVEQAHAPDTYPTSRRMLASLRWHPSRQRSGIGDAGRLPGNSTL
jgi:hypothetical protein